MPSAIFVLFGATGDLARRMVLPAFAALAATDLMPENWVLIGNGRKPQDDAWFADHVREVLGSGDEADEGFAALRDHLMFAGNGFTTDDPGDLPDAWPAPGSARGTTPARALHRPAALDVRAVRAGARRTRARDGLACDLREALRHEPRGVRASRGGGARRPRRGPGVPARPLPREGSDAEPARPALRQPDRRRHLVQRRRGAGADRRPRAPRHRRPRGVLRRDRRRPGHGRHAPVPGRRGDRDGAAPVVRPPPTCSPPASR